MLFKESYEWAKLPTDLPRENLVLVVAKTTASTNHLGDFDKCIRVFKTEELREAARSLAHRPVGLNHEGEPIKLSEADKLLTGCDYAFTVDAQFNEKEDKVEALLFLPLLYVGLIDSKKITEASVEFSVREEKPLEDNRVEEQGIIFNRIDLLYGKTAGDHFTEFKVVGNKSYLEAEASSIGGGLGSSLPPDASTADQPIKDDKMNKDIMNTKVDSPLVDKLYFECPTCHSKYEYDTIKKEWFPGCHEESKVESAAVAKVAEPVKTELPKEDVNIKRIKELEEAVTRLQGNVANSDKEKKEAIVKTKSDVVSKLSAILDNTVVPIRDKTTQLVIDSLKKALTDEQ